MNVEHVWEAVEYSEEEDRYTERMLVPGGYLYRVREYDYDSADCRRVLRGLVVTFVPIEIDGKA